MVEILVTIMILSVLAGLAVPNYFRTMEQARSNEARTNLQIIRMGQKVYALNHGGAYWNGGTAAHPGLDINTINSNLNTDITKQYFDITSITTAPAQAVAMRNLVSGGNNTTTYTIDYATGTIT